jgi:hypothetical protein
MWIFTKDGHLSLGNDPFNPDRLIIHSQLREEMDRFVSILDQIGGQKHEVQPTMEANYRCMVAAKREVVAKAIGKMISEIDYGKFVQSVTFDFGSEPGYLLAVTPTGLQVARVQPQ